MPGRRFYAAELTTGNRLLSRREAEVAALLCRHLRPAEIATILRISARTVERHVGHISCKLSVQNRGDLLRKLLPGRHWAPLSQLDEGSSQHLRG